jgi:hypothetical protein
MKNNRDRALSLLDNVVAGFFGTGEMKVVTAYAMTVLAKAYIEDSLGNDQLKQLTATFEDADDSVNTLMIPDDDSIQNQIRGLVELKIMLTRSTEKERDFMFFLHD